MSKTTANLVVFTQNTHLAHVASLIQEMGDEHLPICISTHGLFDFEMEQIGGRHRVEFHTFADFLSDAEMGSLDEHAFEIEKAEGEESVQSYYRHIKREKNLLILANISMRFELVDGYLCEWDDGPYQPSLNCNCRPSCCNCSN